MLKVFYSVVALFLLGSTARADVSLIDRLQKTERSIVEVKTVYAKVMRVQSKERTVSYERSGAGIVIDASGLIVTNTHTIINAPHIFVILRNGAKLEAQVAFVSPDYDFSFLKIKPQHPLKPITWADSSKAALGQNILAIGNSDYNSQSILGGQIVDLVQSRTTGANELLGINVDLYHGDSGGPILDEQCRLLGIVMAKEKSKERSSFAIASNKIIEQYVQYKKRMP